MQYNVKDLIRLFERDPEILSFKIRDQSLWIILRQTMIQSVINNYIAIDNNPVRSPLSNLFSFLRALFYSLIFPPIKIKKGRVLFIASSLKKTNEKYMNHIIDPLFYSVKSESYVFYEGKNTIKKSFSSSERSLFWMELKINFKSIFKSLNKNDLETLQAFLSFFNQKLEEINLSQTIINQNFIIKRINLYFLKYKYFKSLLSIIKPKVILVEGLCYSRSYITCAANELSIKTGELQHGFIDRNNYAYNLSDQLAQHNSIRYYYPDYFLSFGSYWQSFMNIPTEYIPIGFSFLENFIIKQTLLKNANSILIISNSINPDEIIKFTLKLNDIAKSRKVKIEFRPSPRERSNLKVLYRKLMDDENIKIDTNLNIYDSFLNHKTVVGDYSTVLFEAINFNKSIYLFNTASTKMFCDNELFPKVEIDQLENVFEPNTELFNKIKQHIWSSNPNENLLNFINKLP